MGATTASRMDLPWTKDLSPTLPRFAMVDDRLWRSGQPNLHDLRLLHAQGLRRVVNLRREGVRHRLRARPEAHRLGIEFRHHPFFGVFGASPEFLRRILDDIAAPSNGPVLVHCKNGKDRTSLVVALYRVIHHGWDPERAWQDEVLAYDHNPTRFYRKIRGAYDGMLHEIGI